jgi:hypothetical protein
VDEEPRTKDEGPPTNDEGPRTKDERPRSNDLDDLDDDRRRGPLDDTVPASSEPPGEHGPGLRPLPPSERYRLGAELGRGGMGRVVEAFDLQLGRSVALKEVLPRGGSGIVRRFEREVQLTARLEHPSIVPIYDSGVTPDGRPFYVMRRVSGRPFDELMTRARDLDERLALLPSLLHAIEAVGHAHRRGVIHRDLKPQNILVGELGETVVIDWGLAKVIGEEDPESGELVPSAGDSLQTQIGSVFGTPGFMAPEQARGEELTTRGDVFALGATLYQLLAGIPPVQGTSATEVIDKTARHDMRPLSEVAPGAPPELAAIVDKALSFEAGKRYPHAGALAEDVQRFLTGQLVAAHHYTRVERVARFAKRHRAPLGVAAAAAVAVAVMAWLGVARIIEARDAADTARAAAVSGQAAALKARDALAERHDALIVTQARALLEINPTEAAATLKALAETSPRIADARAIAQAAAVRGVAWALEGARELTTIAELDPEGRRLLQVTRDGVVRVWDLDLRRRVVERPFARDSRALWVAGGRVLVTHGKTPPQLLDPAANTAEPLAIDPIVRAAASAAGERVVFATALGKGAKLFDVASRAVTELDREHELEDLAIAPDGSWVAMIDRERGVVVVDAAGKELARRAGKYLRPVAGARALAVMADDGKIVEWRPAAAPASAWTELPLGLPPPHRVMDLIYRGDELDLWATNGAVLGWNGTRVFLRVQLEKLMNGLSVGGPNALVVAGVDGKLHYATDLARGTLQLPAAMPRHRIAARPGSSRLAVVGDGLIVGFDLAAVIPRAFPMPPGMEARFVDDRTVLANQGVSVDWQWLDLATGATKKFSHMLQGLPMVSEIDAAGGRVLVREIGPTQRLLLFRKNTSDVRVVAEGRAAWGRLLPGDAIVYGVGDGRVFAQVEGHEAREVAKLDGIVESAVATGYRRFAARSSGGEVVRVDLVTDAFERTRVAAGTGGFVAADLTGRVLLADDTKLSAWDGAVTEVAKLDRPIARIEPFEGGVIVHLADNEVRVQELVPGATPHRLLPPGKRQAVTSYDGKLVIGPGNARQLAIVELPSRARWTLPVVFDASDVLSVSPTSRWVVQGSDRHLAVWTLPQAGPDLAAWLDVHTNATVDADGVLTWPWQRGRAP